MITDRLRRMRRHEHDRGFALIFVLMVTTLVMAAVATTLTVTSPNILSSKNNQDVAAAMLAAQSGINDAVAYLTNVPACRSETRICPQALGANSATLNRPSLGSYESFVWTTAPTATSDGNVRVTSTGNANGVRRTLVADLSLNASILNYGYYSDYESQSPAFLNSYWDPRSIYVSDSSTYNDINNTYAGSSNAPGTIKWNGAANGPSAYSDSVCAQHWYSDGTSSPGRGNATNGSTWEETGTLGSKAITDAGSCDLVFTAGMIENGKTYSRDALDIANGSGSGPVFNQPVYTLWGYSGKNTPAVTAATPWRQSDGTGKDLLPNSPYKPATATQDITLPTTIGTDGIETNSCVYYGPTRVVLNGDGTATITSPDTTSAAPGADSGCYPGSLGSSGIVGFTLNYAQFGSGTIYVKNDTTPSTGTWPLTTLRSTSTPSASNETFYFPTTGSASADNPTTAAPDSGCSGQTDYSSSTLAVCAWTSVTSALTSASLGWATAATKTQLACNLALPATPQLFACEYSGTTGTSTPPSGQYGALRNAVQSSLSGGLCATVGAANLSTCLTAYLNGTALKQANTGGHAFDYATPTIGDHRYFATASTGTATTSTQSVGSAPANPMSGDALFAYTGSAGQEQATSTPVSITVSRQVWNGSSWAGGVAQFSLTVTGTTYAITQLPSGAAYFPNTQDVTQYATGANSSGTAAGSSGTSQPGDLYVQGVNQGTLSLVAQNNVEITGDITKGSGQDSSASNPVDIAAGNDIRNYHPVSCDDTSAADINATTPGWCPNDITGVSTGSLLSSNGTLTAQHPAAQYDNLTNTGDRTIDAALFALTGSLRTDNYNRGAYVGNLVVNGGLYQSHRGANGVTWGNTGSNTPGHSGTSLNYNYVDLTRAGLQYVPSASYSNNPRVWNIVSISAGTNPAGAS